MPYVRPAGFDPLQAAGTRYLAVRMLLFPEAGGLKGFGGSHSSLVWTANLDRDRHLLFSRSDLLSGYAEQKQQLRRKYAGPPTVPCWTVCLPLPRPGFGPQRCGLHRVPPLGGTQAVFPNTSAADGPAPLRRFHVRQDGPLSRCTNRSLAASSSGPPSNRRVANFSWPVIHHAALLASMGGCRAEPQALAPRGVQRPPPGRWRVNRVTVLVASPQPHPISLNLDRPTKAAAGNGPVGETFTSAPLLMRAGQNGRAIWGHLRLGVAAPTSFDWTAHQAQALAGACLGGGLDLWEARTRLPGFNGHGVTPLDLAWSTRRAVSPSRAPNLGH